MGFRPKRKGLPMIPASNVLVEEPRVRKRAGSDLWPPCLVVLSQELFRLELWLGLSSASAALPHALWPAEHGSSRMDL